MLMVSPELGQVLQLVNKVDQRIELICIHTNLSPAIPAVPDSFCDYTWPSCLCRSIPHVFVFVSCSSHLCHSLQHVFVTLSGFWMAYPSNIDPCWEHVPLWPLANGTKGSNPAQANGFEVSIIFVIDRLFGIARLNAIQKVTGSIPGYTLEFFLEV